MIWYCYVIFNKKINAFERPVITFHEKDEFIEVLKRDYHASDVNNQAKLRDNICYYVGSYDDNSAKFNLVDNKELLIDLAVLDKPVEEKVDG